jgi:hypothetical protein
MTIVVATLLSTSCDMAKILVQLLGRILPRNLGLIKLHSTIFVGVLPRKVIEDWPFPGSLHRSQCAIHS